MATSAPTATNALESASSSLPNIHVHLPQNAVVPAAATAPANSVSNSTNYIHAINAFVKSTGVVVKGKTMGVAYNEGGLNKARCSQCNEKIHKQSCVAEFTIRVVDEKTQTATIECPYVICDTCLTSETARGAISEMMDKKRGRKRARPIARNIVAIFSPLLRICMGEGGIHTVEKVVDIVVSLLIVMLIGGIFNYIINHR